MTESVPDLQQLLNRVEKLEKTNRRLKHFAAAALMLIGTVFLMGQASPNRTLEANRFILTDSAGKVRGSLSMSQKGPQLAFLDANGQTRVVLEAGDTQKLTFLRPNGREGAHLTSSCVTQAPGSCLSSLGLTSGDEKYQILLMTDPLSGSMLGFTEPPREEDFPTHAEYTKALPRIQVRLAGGGTTFKQAADLTLFHSGGGGVSVESDEDGPRVKLLDGEGFQATVGNTALVTPSTGQKRKTSAASVILFDKDKNVIWQAP